MRRIPDVTKATLTEFVLDHVARGAEVHSDGWQGYFDVGRHRFKHVVTNVSASGTPRTWSCRQVHRLASLVKRWILGTHQGAISHAQLDFYLDEQWAEIRRMHRVERSIRVIHRRGWASPRDDRSRAGQRSAAGLSPPRPRSSTAQGLDRGPAAGQPARLVQCAVRAGRGAGLWGRHGEFRRLRARAAPSFPCP